MVMETEKEFKRRVLSELIRLKQDKLTGLRNAQRGSLADIDNGDIDYSDPAESPREQLIDEIGQTSSSSDFLAAEIETLKGISADEPIGKVGLGALVQTSSDYFFIAAANEPFTVDGKKITGVSVNAPLFTKMKGLSKKASFHVGNAEHVILNIF
jgi:hypothetical protein